jgi:hypothetical protein
VGRSRSGSTVGVGRVVVREPRIPALEGRPQRSVEEGTGAGLQQQVSAAPYPLHLLLLGEPLAEHRVHRALDEGGRDPLPNPEPLAVVDDTAGVLGKVDRELVRRPPEPPQVRVGHLEPVDVRLEVLDLR